MKRPGGRTWRIVAATALLLAGALLYANPYKVGRVTGEYKGVPVRENGIWFFASHGKHYAPNGYQIDSPRVPVGWLRIPAAEAVPTGRR